MPSKNTGTKSPISIKQSDLEEVIEEVYMIACSQTGCNVEEISTYDAAYDFFKAGWRVVDGEWSCCPECVKKIRAKLKKKK